MTPAKFNIIIPPQDIEQNPQCLQRVAAGNRNAFEWLYKNYCRRLYDYIQILTNDKFLSEDIVQEVFLRIWINKEKLTDVANFNAYIHFVAKNLLTDKWRKTQTEKEVIKNITAPQQQTEHNLFFQRQEEKQYNMALKSLTSSRELVFRLIREEGLTREQVSKTLKISPNTVKATMQNALYHIKKSFTEL